MERSRHPGKCSFDLLPIPLRAGPRRKLLTLAALALGMAVATAALSVSLDVGDRLAQEFRSLGANLLVTPQADSLPLEIGGVDYRPANAGAYLPEADLGKLKTIFWRFNIMAFAPILEVPVRSMVAGLQELVEPGSGGQCHADRHVVGAFGSDSRRHHLCDGNREDESLVARGREAGLRRQRMSAWWGRHRRRSSA